MSKKIILVLALLPLLLAGCDKDNISPESSTPSSAPSSAPANDDSSSESEPAPASISSNNQTTPTPSSNSTSPSSPSSAKELTEAEIIGAKIKEQAGGKVTKTSTDTDDTYTYTFSYGGGSSFTISSSISNRINAYSFKTSITFNWGELKDAAFNGEASEGSTDILRCTIECDYGTAPEITYKSHTVTETTYTSDKTIKNRVNTLVSSHQKAYGIAQDFVKTIKSSYKLW